MLIETLLKVLLLILIFLLFILIGLVLKNWLQSRANHNSEEATSSKDEKAEAARAVN